MENTTVKQQRNTNIFAEQSVPPSVFFGVFLYQLLNIIGSKGIISFELRFENYLFYV